MSQNKIYGDDWDNKVMSESDLYLEHQKRKFDAKAQVAIDKDEVDLKYVSQVNKSLNEGT